MPNHPNREIILDRTDAETDRDWSADEHEILFGHSPQPGKDGRCTHPSHNELRRLMEAPGVEAEVLFDPNTVISEDSRIHVDAERAYSDRVEYWRQQIALTEERQRYLDALDPNRPKRRALRRAERRRMEREVKKIEREMGVSDG